MSRFATGDFDETFPNQAEFWRHNAQLALKGKRGKKALADLREALLALPQHRLIKDTLSTSSLQAAWEDEPDEYQWGTGTRPNWAKGDAMAFVAKEGIGVCAVGAYCWWQKVKAGEAPDEAMRSLPVIDPDRTDGDYATMQAGKAAGLTSYVAWTLGDLNDETLRKCTPEERWERVLAWIDKELAS